MTFLSSIESAFIVFPIVAFIFTIPYLAYQYHKYGSVPFYRSIIIYSFLLYLLCSYFLVILPLPDKNYVFEMRTPQFNLIPFHFISEITARTSFHVSDFATYFPTLKNPVVYEAIFNIFLLIPFGIYLRYYFNFNFKKTSFYSFCYSLFFELTQLTGLYFIYSRGYRVFDVDDLILNTFGGIIGFFIGNIIQKILPSKNVIDAEAYSSGKKVPFLRRSICFFTDICILGIVYITSCLLLNKIINITYSMYIIIFLIAAICYYVVAPLLLNNSTLAMKFYHLRFKSFRKIGPIKLLSYYFFNIFVYIFIPIFFIGGSLILYKYSIITVTILKYLLIATFTISFSIYMVAILKRILNHRTIPEYLSKIEVENTLTNKWISAPRAFHF